MSKLDGPGAQLPTRFWTHARRFAVRIAPPAVTVWIHEMRRLGSACLAFVPGGELVLRSPRVLVSARDGGPR